MGPSWTWGSGGGQLAALRPALFPLGLHLLVMLMGSLHGSQGLGVERVARLNTNAVGLEVVGHGVRVVAHVERLPNLGGKTAVVLGVDGDGPFRVLDQAAFAEAGFVLLAAVNLDAVPEKLEAGHGFVWVVERPPPPLIEY